MKRKAKQTNERYDMSSFDYSAISGSCNAGIVYSLLFAPSMSCFYNKNSLIVLTSYLSIMLMGKGHFFVIITDVMHICPAKIVSCPSKNRFDRKTSPTPARKFFQALLSSGVYMYFRLCMYDMRHFTLFTIHKCMHNAQHLFN